MTLLLPGRRTGGDAPEGFVLVGVVMFVLVLTILGLSLFSLSSFEAQFLRDSSERSQCFQAAMGGLERAKWVLVNTGRLQDVRLNLPRDSVDYAEARQGSGQWEECSPDGDVAWDGDPIRIRVRGVVSDVSRTYEARFQPTQPIDIYRRLMALSGGNPDSALVVTAYYRDDPTTLPRGTQTDLTGEVWQNSPSTARAAPAFSDPNYHTFGGVPTPDLDSYFTRMALLGPQPLDDPTSSAPVTLDGSSWPNGVGLFESFGGSHDDPDNWSVHWDTGNPRINVDGTAIWMVNRGFWIQNRLDIQGTVGGPADFLVLVAKPSTRPASTPHWDAGIALLGGLTSTVPVILVSNGRVEIVHENHAGDPSLAPYLSIFASHALIMGPEAPVPPPPFGLPPRLSLTHPLSGPLFDAADPIIDLLYELRLLPNTDAGLEARLTLMAGTWRELKPN